MGLFDGLFAIGDIIKGGIETAKAGEKLDNAVGRAVTDFDDKLTDEDRNAYTKWKMADEKVKAMNAKDSSKVTPEMTEEVTASQIAFLMGLTKNKNIPQDFKNEINMAVEEYKKVDANATDRVKQRMLKMAKTEEEKQAIIKSFEEEK